MASGWSRCSHQNPAIDFCPTATTTRDTLANMWENPAPANTAWGTMGSTSCPYHLGAVPEWRAVMESTAGCSIPLITGRERNTGGNSEIQRRSARGMCPCSAIVYRTGAADATGSATLKYYPTRRRAMGACRILQCSGIPTAEYPVNLAFFADNSVRIVGLKQLWALSNGAPILTPLTRPPNRKPDFGRNG